MCTVSFMMMMKVISAEVGWDGSPAYSLHIQLLPVP